MIAAFINYGWSLLQKGLTRLESSQKKSSKLKKLLPRSHAPGPDVFELLLEPVEHVVPRVGHEEVLDACLDGDRQELVTLSGFSNSLVVTTT